MRYPCQASSLIQSEYHLLNRSCRPVFSMHRHRYSIVAVQYITWLPWLRSGKMTVGILNVFASSPIKSLVRLGPTTPFPSQILCQLNVCVCDLGLGSCLNQRGSRGTISNYQESTCACLCKVFYRGGKKIYRTPKQSHMGLR